MAACGVTQADRLKITEMQSYDLNGLTHDLLCFASSVHLCIIKAAFQTGLVSVKPRPAAMLVSRFVRDDITTAGTHKLTPASRQMVISFLACMRDKVIQQMFESPSMRCSTSHQYSEPSTPAQHLLVCRRSPRLRTTER